MAHGIFSPEVLEELIVQRELAVQLRVLQGRVDSLENVPDWAKKDMREHASDKQHGYLPMIVRAGTPTLTCGTPRSARCSAMERSTATSACIGARR